MIMIAKKEDIKTKRTIIIITVILYFILTCLTIGATTLKFISILICFLIIFIPLFLFALIFGIIYILKQSTQKDTIRGIDKKKKLDATTMIDWTKEYILNNYCDNIELGEKRIIQVGTKEDRVPIGYIKCKGTTSFKIYNLFLNLIEPEALNSIRFNELTEEEIQKEADNLGYSPIRIPKRIIKRRTPMGEEIEEEDLLPTDVEEVESEL